MVALHLNNINIGREEGICIYQVQAKVTWMYVISFKPIAYDLTSLKHKLRVVLMLTLILSTLSTSRQLLLNICFNIHYIIKFHILFLFKSHITI